MRAAFGAVAFEHPKLIATAVVNENSFAELLEKRIARYQEMERTKLIEHQASEVIEQPTNGDGSEPTNGQSDKPQSASLARIYSNKFRRRL